MPKRDIQQKQQEESKVMVDQQKDIAISAKSGSKYNVGRITTFCKNGRFADRIGAGTPIFVGAVLEYITSEILLLASQEAKADGISRIKPRHIMLAIRKDPELNKYFAGADFSQAGVLPSKEPTSGGKKKGKVVDDAESD